MSSSLLTTLDADEMCAEAPQVSANGDLSKYDECVSLYTSLQENLPSFAEKTTDVNVVSVSAQVYHMGEFFGYYTGMALGIQFTERNTGAYLETRAYRIEKGCADDQVFFYKSVVCYSLSGEPVTDPEETASQGCQAYMPAIVFAADLSECPEFDSGSLVLYDPTENLLYQNIFVTDPVVLKLHTTFAETIEALVESAE